MPPTNGLYGETAIPDRMIPTKKMIDIKGVGS
jgi:hypothetical protein